jgi:predicted Zn finger-like uncharacterized protein
MLTQCPSCQTTFRVTSEILRVAHGQVRCGRCQTQFDALERLIEENADGEIETGRYLRPPRALPQPSPWPGQIEVEEPMQHEEVTLEGRHIEISGVYETIDESGQGEPQMHEEVIEEWVEIGAEDATLDTEPDVIDMQQEYSTEADEDEDILAVAAAMEEDERAAQAARSGQWAAPQPTAHFTNNRSRGAGTARSGGARAAMAAPSKDFDFPTPQRDQPTRGVWNLFALPLALLLLVQVVHNYRATLARHPQIGAPLQGIYSVLGLTLRPDWNLHAYEVQQWGVTSDPSTPGTLKVRASVKNLAGFAQPYPLLKLVLEDRWGDQVRAREFEPEEYLDPTTAPDRLLAPAQQTNATITIVDPGPDAEGFRFDVCLPGVRGPVCAADVPARK